MKVIVNQGNCIGCGACEAMCSEVFALNDDGLSTVITDNFDNVDKDAIREAAEGCPTTAIEVEE